ncbi:MAG: DNA/RNA nuclease SfsA [Promethearchaeota archaeon]
MHEAKKHKGAMLGFLLRLQGVNPVKLQGPFLYGHFLERPNRFLTVCQLNGRKVLAYMPNPGPMPDLLHPGVEVLLRHNPGIHRKTDYDLVCSRSNGAMLSLDSRVPNWLLAEVLPLRQLAPFSQYQEIIPEPVYRTSRLDFCLRNETLPTCYIEAKSSTDTRQSIGLFPRVPTERGQRHVQELMHAVDEGFRAAIVFIVQRTDAAKMKPNDPIDPEFGTILRKAVNYGVEAYAWTTRFIEPTCEIIIDREIPVDLSPPLTID